MEVRWGVWEANDNVCFAVPEKEVKAVAEALQSRFRQALDNGRLSQVLNPILLKPNACFCSIVKTWFTWVISDWRFIILHFVDLKTGWNIWVPCMVVNCSCSFVVIFYVAGWCGCCNCGHDVAVMSQKTFMLRLQLWLQTSIQNHGAMLLIFLRV